MLSDQNVHLTLRSILALWFFPGLATFLVDGFFRRGFLLRTVQIPSSDPDCKVTIKFGDIFDEKGWRAVGVNDFFDSTVDDDLVSTNSLNRKTITRFWGGNVKDWERQIDSCLKRLDYSSETRERGRERRYPIGTTARAFSGNDKFLFVALAKTNAETNVASGDTEMVIRAVRGMAREARAACSLEPLVVPLLGSGLARTGIKNSVLVDMILAAIFEESREGRITGDIRVVLPKDKASQINLKNHVRNWSSGK